MSRPGEPYDDRRAARVLAVQTLCQLDVQGDSFTPQIDRFLVDAIGTGDIVTVRSATDRDALRSRAGLLARRTWEGRERYDELLKANVSNWQPERLALVDHAILRMALYEMLDEQNMPPKAAIDEAIELAKVFGGADSPRFVNGVLDAVLRVSRGGAEAIAQPGETGGG